MTKATMIKWYRKKSACDTYIIGFIANKQVYFSTLNEIKPSMLSIEQASRGQGENLRFRVKAKHKKALLKKATCLGSTDILIDSKYNKGEIFEKLITEYFGQKWSKDTTPFWIKGDININGQEVQVKFDGGTLLNTKQINKFKKATLDRKG